MSSEDRTDIFSGFSAQRG